MPLVTVTLPDYPEGTKHTHQPIGAIWVNQTRTGGQILRGHIGDYKFVAFPTSADGKSSRSPQYRVFARVSEAERNQYSPAPQVTPQVEDIPPEDSATWEKDTPAPSWKTPVDPEDLLSWTGRK